MSFRAEDLIFVDGVLVEGYQVKCDVSEATGESDLIEKVDADFALANSKPGVASSDEYDQFILSGSKVMDGMGTYLVTAVGAYSYHGRTQMGTAPQTFMKELTSGLREAPEHAVLRNRACKKMMSILGLAAALLFFVNTIKFLARLHGDSEGSEVKGQQFLAILMDSIAVALVVLSESLPLTFAFIVTFGRKKMKQDTLQMPIKRSQHWGLLPLFAVIRLLGRITIGGE